MTSIGGPSFTENGTFMSTEELLKNGASPQTAFMAQIINGTVQKGNEMESSLRNNIMQEMGKGIKVNTEA